MAKNVPASVTIIGAGFSGLGLALVLHSQSIPVNILEWRNPKEGVSIGGAVMLSPNSLRIMDKLGIYERIKARGYTFQRLDFCNDKFETQAHYYFGSKQVYGYDGLRIYRQILIEVMTEMLRERNVPIHYGQQFSKVLDDSPGGVVFETADGTKHRTGMVIGADGIHSTVRKYLTLAKPLYSGMIGVTSAIPARALRLPTGREEVHLPVTIMGKRGGFVIAPQEPDGSELLVGLQHKHAELDQAGWRALVADKQKVIAMLRAGKEDWPDMVQSAMEAVDGSKVNVWPFYMLPNLEHWASKTGRVVLIGDSAHAIPPSAGQGINQAFEDCYTLGLLLPKFTDPKIHPDSALRFWQEWRQERVNKVLQLNKAMEMMRMPEAERKNVQLSNGFEKEGSASGGEGQLKWLYEPNLEDELDAWVASQ